MMRPCCQQAVASSSADEQPLPDDSERAGAIAMSQSGTCTGMAASLRKRSHSNMAGTLGHRQVQWPEESLDNTGGLLRHQLKLEEEAMVTIVPVNNPSMSPLSVRAGGGPLI